MKLLLLSSTTGEGHNSCAKALKKYFDAHDIQNVMLDTIGFANKSVAKGVSDAYVFSTGNYLFPILYNIGEGLSRIIAPFSKYIKSPVYWVNMLYAKKLNRYISQEGFDGIICTHLFPAEAVTALRRKGNLQIPAIYVMTDYVCIPFVPETQMDKYVIAHKDLISHFKKKRIPQDRIVPIGIPVSEEKFTVRMDKMQARKIICDAAGLKFEDNDDGRWFLLMSGSMGFGDLGALITELLKHCRKGDRILCVCGNNDTVRKHLQEQFKGSEYFSALGFTNRIATLMDASDVLLTKPGGLTSTEAAVKNIPLIHTSPIPGLEKFNCRFFHSRGMSYSTSDVKEQAAVAIRLCEDAGFREKMLLAQRENTNSFACRDVALLMQRLIDESRSGRA